MHKPHIYDHLQTHVHSLLTQMVNIEEITASGVAHNVILLLCVLHIFYVPGSNG